MGLLTWLPGVSRYHAKCCVGMVGKALWVDSLVRLVKRLQEIHLLGGHTIEDEGNKIGYLSERQKSKNKYK